VAILDPIILVIIAILAIGIPLAWAGGMLVQKSLITRKIGEATEQSRRIVEEAQRNAETRLKDAAIEAKELAYKARVDLEKEVKERQKEIQQVERRLLQKEEQVSRRLDQLDRRDRDYHSKEEGLTTRERGLKELEERRLGLIDEQRRALERVAGLTAEEAKQRLLAQMEDEARREATLIGMRLEEEARQGADRKAREVLATTIQRLAPDYTVETAVSIVDLPSDDMKGRIIGREGRNIRALELATGVDLIVDDTPEAVILSGFDPFRREIARVSLERLIVDGRIHPARIEEVVEKVKAEFEERIQQEGEAALLELKIPRLHVELVKLLGRLRYRTSYGQNVLNHSKEVAWLAGAMAAELKANVQVAKRAGLLHDIGKAVDREMDGTHLEIGIDLLRKYGETEEVVHAMACHHGDYDPQTVEAVLVTASDALSAARPGARREILETYVKRLEKLEEIASSFKGVQKCFAIQAGREIRIIVDSKKIPDEQAIWLSRDIARKIEADLTYPGQIKVTVIRETRSIEYAK
jgi:ribonucrease Y